MSEPREWWLQVDLEFGIESDSIWIAWSTGPKNSANIHVIEKSAYDQIKAENDNYIQILKTIAGKLAEADALLVWLRSELSAYEVLLEGPEMQALAEYDKHKGDKT